MSARRSKPGETLLSIRDVLYISGLLVSLGIMIGKVNSVTSDLEQFKAKYTAEVVPRQEHIQMNNVTEERWKSVGSRLDHVESQLEAIKNQISNIRR